MASRRSATLGPDARPVAIPHDIADTSVDKAHGTVELPLHVRWSGSSKVYDLTSRPDRLRVYEQILSEGTDDDIRRYIDVNELLDANGLRVERRQIGHGFARLVVHGEGEETLIDLGADARLLPPEKTAHGLALSGEELAIDKVLAIFGRAEPRDFVDLGSSNPDTDWPGSFGRPQRRTRLFSRRCFGRCLVGSVACNETSSRWTTGLTSLWPGRLRAGRLPSTNLLKTRDRVIQADPATVGPARDR
jgi:hypothetical protein